MTQPGHHGKCAPWKGKFLKYCVILDVNGHYQAFERRGHKQKQMIVFRHPERPSKRKRLYEYIVFETNSLREAFLKARHLNHADGVEIL